MKKTIICCISALLMTTTCLANPIQGLWDNENLMKVSSRLVQNYVHVVTSRQSELPRTAQLEKIRDELLEAAGRRLVECYTNREETGITRFADLYESLPASLKPALTPVIGSLMEYLLSTARNLDARDTIRRWFPIFETQFTSRLDEDVRETALYDKQWMVDQGLVPTTIEAVKTFEKGAGDLLDIIIEWGLFTFDSEECSATGHVHDGCSCTFSLPSTEYWEVVEAGRKFNMGRMVNLTGTITGTITGTTFRPEAVQKYRILLAYGQNTLPSSNRFNPIQDFKYKQYIFSYDLAGTLNEAALKTVYYLTGQELTQELSLEDPRTQEKAAEEAGYWYNDYVPGSSLPIL